MTSAPGGVMGWILQYGQVIAFFAQLLYWLVIAVAAVWATLLFKRLVDHKTSGPATAAAPARDVDVEEFTD